MSQYVLVYVTTAVIFLGIDFVWLSQVATRFYVDRIGHLMLEKPHLGAAAAFYAVYVVGIVIFASVPALKSGSLSTGMLYGALFGFFCYATYDMTNYATLRDWPLLVVAVDVAWGTILTAVSAALGVSLTRLILN